MINKSATHAATITWENGNKVAIYLGSNSNTGETIAWQKVAGHRSQRITGANLTKLASELRAVRHLTAVHSEAAYGMLAGA